ncbi:BTB/POZ domain protein, partial [Rhizoctonia solani AG-3 Rhs1AP]
MLSSAPNLAGGNNNAQSLFTPPGGGDITLRSSDGIDFPAHSTHLKLASSVFADMISTGTKKDTVQLAEDATGVSYLLRFIYPNRLPLTIGPDALSVCLAVVHKYDVGGALEIIDELIVLDTLPHKLLSPDPLRAHQLATQFNLAKTKVAVAHLITLDRVDFCDLNKVLEHAQKYSSRRLVYLMNIQAMRAKVLSDVLFRFDKAPILPEHDHNLYRSLSCDECRGNADRQEGYRKLPPSWVLAWVRLIYDTLLVSSEPLEEFGHLFQSTILQKFNKREDVCQDCLSDFNKESYSSQGPTFDRWAQTIKQLLETEFAKLELVYAL